MAMLDNTFFGILGSGAGLQDQADINQILARLQAAQDLQTTPNTRAFTPMAGLSVAEQQNVQTVPKTTPAQSPYPEEQKRPLDNMGTGNLPPVAGAVPQRDVPMPAPGNRISASPVQRAPIRMAQAETNATPDFAPGFGEMVSDFGNALTGQAGAGNLRQRTMQRNATYKALLGMGFDANTAQAAVLNPDILKVLLASKLGTGKAGANAAAKQITWGTRKNPDGTIEWVPMQVNEKAEALATKLPEGVTAVPPGDIAEQKRYGTEKGKLRAKEPELFRQTKGKIRNLDMQFNTVNEDIDRLKKTIAQQGYVPGTGAGAFLKNIPWTDAIKIRGLLDTIKSNIGFDKLQAMRDASPTGGALGQVSEFENRLLQSTSGTLEQDQDANTLLYNLDRIKKNWNELNQAYHTDFKEQFGIPNDAVKAKDGNYYTKDPQTGKYIQWP